MPKKQQNKGPKKKFNPPKPVATEPVFRYTSACCGLKAIKPALLKTPEAEGTLGSWRCSSCGESCKCNRSKAKPEGQQVGTAEGADK
jgi:hypothetical protein